MKPALRHRSVQKEEPKYPNPTVPHLTQVEKNRKPIANLDTKKMQAISHNAIMWVDHGGGTVLDKSSSPVAASLDMEHRQGEVEARFWVYVSAQGNGSMGLSVWFKGELVFNMGDVPRGSYLYPSDKLQVSTYIHGAWEKFLMDKGFHKSDG